MSSSAIHDVDHCEFKPHEGIVVSLKSGLHGSFSSLFVGLWKKLIAPIPHVNFKLGLNSDVAFTITKFFP